MGIEKQREQPRMVIPNYKFVSLSKVIYLRGQAGKAYNWNVAAPIEG